jgi:hypothetical protein
MELSQKTNEFLERTIAANLITFKNDSGETVAVFAQEFVTSMLAKLALKIEMAADTLTKLEKLVKPEERGLVSVCLQNIGLDSGFFQGEQIQDGDVVEVSLALDSPKRYTVTSAGPLHYIELESGETILVGARNLMFDLPHVKKIVERG